MVTTQAFPEKLIKKIAKVKLVALDVDGVLTDGGVYILEDGSEFRRFDIKDGQGIRQIIDEGILVFWITSGTSESIFQRGRKLGVTEICLEVKDKALALKRLCTQTEVDLSEVLYMGDDIVDLEAISLAGVSCAPRDAINIILESVDIITTRPGGHGAVREVCDLLMRHISNKE